jgi:hypothetical protein
MAAEFDYVILNATSNGSITTPTGSGGTLNPSVYAVVSGSSASGYFIQIFSKPMGDQPAQLLGEGQAVYLGSTTTGLLLGTNRQLGYIDDSSDGLAAYNTGTYFFLSKTSEEATAFNNGTVTLSPYDSNPCFLRGTEILTRRGYIPVEDLDVGEEILTLDSDWQPLRWIGHREIDRAWNDRFHHDHYPIRIRSGAFGPGIPKRDVWISPEHAVFFRDHLIPAKSLVNGISVMRDTTVESIEYFHILLDRHGVIFSEGLPSESYIPMQDIDVFDNFETCPILIQKRYLASIGCFPECYPRVTCGPIVEAAHGYLARSLAVTAEQVAA